MLPTHAPEASDSSYGFVGDLPWLSPALQGSFCGLTQVPMPCRTLSNVAILYKLLLPPFICPISSSWEAIASPSFPLLSSTHPPRQTHHFLFLTCFYLVKRGVFKLTIVLGCSSSPTPVFMKWYPHSPHPPRFLPLFFFSAESKISQSIWVLFTAHHSDSE